MKRLRSRITLLDFVTGLFVVTGFVLAAVKSLVGARATDLRLAVVILAGLVAGGERVLPWVKHRGEDRRAFDSFKSAVQADSSESQYVVLRGIIPPLTEIYVDPLLAQDRPADSRSIGTNRIEEVLKADTNVLVVGDPGSGKSALANHVVTSETQRTPVRVRATSLVAQEGPFPSRLRAAVILELGLALGTELPAHFFEMRPGQWNRSAGERWLVVIDGLDEVADLRERQALLGAIGSLAIDSPSLYQFLVTSRPLDELRALDGPRFHTYRIQWFDPDRQKRFAKKWFEARHRENEAAVFLERLGAITIGGLAGVPLILTMAAVVFEENKKATLPTTRAGFYERFLDVLLDDAIADDEPLAAFRVVGARRRLLEHIAASQEGLLDAAIDYVLNNDLVAAEASQDYLRRELRGVLRRTGLVVSRSEGEDFLHFTFRDYLAMSRLARRDPGSADEVVSRWVSLWHQFGYRELVLLLFGIWAYRGRDVTRLLEDLVDIHTDDGALFAGEALANGAVVSPELEEQIVAALMSDVQEFEILGPMSVLTAMAGRPMVQGALLAFCMDSRNPVLPRIHAARALWDQGDHVRPVSILVDMITNPPEQFFSVNWVIDQLETWEQRDELRTLAECPALDTLGKQSLGETLQRLGLVDEGTRLLVEAAMDPRGDGIGRLWAAEALHDYDPNAVVCVLKALIADDQGPGVREPAAVELVKMGEDQEAAFTVLFEVAAEPAADRGSRQAALHAIGTHGAIEQLPRLLELARKSTRDPDIRFRCIQAAIELGAYQEALVLSESDGDAWVVVAGLAALLDTALGEEAIALLLERASRNEVPPDVRLDISGILGKRGHPDVAHETLGALLKNKEIGPWERLRISQQLVELGYPVEGLPGIVAVARQPRHTTHVPNGIDPRIEAARDWAALEATDEPVAVLRGIAVDLTVSEMNRRDAARALRDLGRLDLVWDLPFRFI